MAKKSHEDEMQDVILQDFCEKLGLEIVNSGAKAGDTKEVLRVSTYHINRPGLQLAGFFEHFVFRRVQVCGEMENTYLLSMDKKHRQAALDKVFEYKFPCMIVTSSLPPCEEMVQSAKKYGRVLLKSRDNTTHLVNKLTQYLNEILAQSITIHGVLVDVYGVGMLITGDSGVGKSEVALELVQRNHRLVADDAVVIKNINDLLIGSSPPTIRHFMEVRGIGIVDIRSIYGAGAIRNSKKIEMIVELEEWAKDKEYDRLGNKGQDHTILEKTIPKFKIPVKTGRNLAVILEVAARNFRLKGMGYDPLKELNDRMMKGF
ncbi:MAG: HPr(Ser) kinase/phosphatase [Firmicutes bacterium]|nr:HPr(Ser) kinase/phosphatase [Bacillota bacterium]